MCTCVFVDNTEWSSIEDACRSCSFVFEKREQTSDKWRIMSGPLYKCTLIRRRDIVAQRISPFDTLIIYKSVPFIVKSFLVNRKYDRGAGFLLTQLSFRYTRGLRLRFLTPHRRARQTTTINDDTRFFSCTLK